MQVHRSLSSRTEMTIPCDNSSTDTISHENTNSQPEVLTSPQAIWKEATTLSPILSPVTLAPIASTTPQNSWPRMSPFCSSTMLPCRRCKSLPQTVLPVTFKSTSLLSTSLGLGTSPVGAVSTFGNCSEHCRLTNCHFVLAFPAQGFHSSSARIREMFRIPCGIRDILRDCRIALGAWLGVGWLLKHG